MHEFLNTTRIELLRTIGSKSVVHCSFFPCIGSWPGLLSFVCVEGHFAPVLALFGEETNSIVKAPVLELEFLSNTLKGGIGAKELSFVA